MNALDGVIVVLVLAAAWGGHQLGFLTRALSWVGMAAGLVAAAALSPHLVDRWGGEGTTSTFVLVTAALVLGAGLGHALGMLGGGRLRVGLRRVWSHRVDALAGAAMAAAGVTVCAWMLLGALAGSPTWPADLARTSALRQALPEPPDPLDRLERLIGPDRFPRVISIDASVEGPPPTTSGIDPEVVARAATSVVRISGVACGRTQEGSGVVVADEVVLTNAHVVAGADAPTVRRDDGEVLDARIIGFDAARDTAVLVVAGLDRAPLPRGRIDLGEDAAVIGHPGGGDVEVSPARADRRLVATGRDLYGSRAPSRNVILVAAELAPGDSGAPLVTRRGTLAGLAFAVAPGQQAAYVLDLEEIEGALGDIDPSGPPPETDCLAS